MRSESIQREVALLKRNDDGPILCSECTIVVAEDARRQDLSRADIL
jgi:hypothetical protein